MYRRAKSRYNGGVRTETTRAPIAPLQSRSGAASGPLIRLIDPRLILILLLALAAGALAYQAPPTADVQVGWLGDQLFLRTSEGLGASEDGAWYGDELTDHAQSGRSRWTRQNADLLLPGLQPAGDLELTLRARGWPADALNPRTAQPTVTILANTIAIGSSPLSSEWANYRFAIPANVATTSGDLHLTISASDILTGTRSYPSDTRPKGVRVEYLGIRSVDLDGPLLPAAQPLAWLALVGGLAWLAAALALRRSTLAFVLATLLVAVAALGLALYRAWAVVVLPVAALLLLVLLLVVARGELLRLLRILLRHYSYGAALNYGLVVAAAAWMAGLVATLSRSAQFPVFRIFRETFPDSILYGLLGMGLLLLAVIRGREGLPRLSNALVGLLNDRTSAVLLLGLFLLVWVGSLAWVIAGLPYVGHADYADNAVVARNLVAGRGWVVDYVTQFYRLYNGTTRPQETWPLLQPVLIAPFFMLFGANAWAAKIPNLLFITLLGLLVYTTGSRLWDRRVGLTAAVLVLTSHLFFKLVIYTTNDLAFVVFTFGALWLAYRFTNQNTAGTRWLLAAGCGLLTGLMLLQKPGSGGLIALGMGLWLLQTWVMQLRQRPGSNRHPFRSFVQIGLWAALALLVLTPYLARNLATFGRPFYSTESTDAWVLEYTDWEAIYSVYAPELSASGIPDRSWVLRWGFDRSLRKISNQVLAVRNYLAPPWKDLPLGLSDTLSGQSGKALLFGSGAWLAFLGALGALRSRRHLLGLLLAAFGPYTLFLILYWHANEERYWVVLMPWLALLGAYALWRGYERVAAIGDRRWTPVALALVCAALYTTIGPSWPKIAEKVQQEPQIYAADIDAYTWLRANTSPGEVAMTRAPWQLNWHSQRPALMIPNTGDPAIFLQIAQHYHARYLVLDVGQRPSQAVLDLINRLIDDPQQGFRSVYRTPTYWAIIDGKRTPLASEIYAFPADYGGVAALR